MVKRKIFEHFPTYEFNLMFFNLIGQARRNNSNNGGMNSSTAWAVEVGGQNPIVVEDLGSGQMLIEVKRTIIRAYNSLLQNQ